MKLSVERRLGYVQVRGGRVVTVAHDHQVHVSTYDKAGSEGEYRRSFDHPWVTAKIGDVAIEIVVAANGNLIGHTYLSGDAICLNHYGVASAHWFAPGIGWRVSFPAAPTGSVEEMIAAVLQCKHAPAHVVAFDLELRDRDEVMEVGQWFAEAYGYEPEPADPQPPLPNQSHFLGFLHTSKRKGPIIALHFQPPHQASQFAAQPFQVQVVLASTELKPVDVFAAGVELWTTGTTG